MNTQRVARGIELANYFLLIPATIWIANLWHTTFQHHFVNLFTPDSLVVQFAPTAFLVLGLSLHVLYFQHARHKTMRVSPTTLWLLSTVYNLILTVYLLRFGTFVVIVFIWPACIAILSFACFLATDKRNEGFSRPL